ncbi:bromodomain, NET domain protein [Tanacetum coccineum]
MILSPLFTLGFPLEKKHLVSWDTVVNRVRNRLSSWKAKSLSIGGRLTLVKSVLGSIPIFYLSLFKSPVKIIDMLESLRCRFFWGFKEGQSSMYWVKWNSILLDSKSGGLGGGFNSPINSFKTSGIWVDIIKAVKNIEAIDVSFDISFMRKVVDGGSTLFWKDPWSGVGSCLMDIFPRLYALDSCKDCLVKDRWKFENGVNIMSKPSHLGFNLSPLVIILLENVIGVTLGASSNCPVNNKISLTKDDPEVGEDRNERDLIAKTIEEDVFPAIQRVSKTWIAACLLTIIRKRNDQLAQEGDEIELDIEALDTETLWELDRFVTNWKKFVSKTKRQALMVNSASVVPVPSVSADIDDVPMSKKIDGVEKNKKEAREEDVDIGDEMPKTISYTSKLRKMMVVVVKAKMQQEEYTLVEQDEYTL